MNSESKLPVLCVVLSMLYICHRWRKCLSTAIGGRQAIAGPSMALGPLIAKTTQLMVIVKLSHKTNMDSIVSHIVYDQVR